MISRNISSTLKRSLFSPWRDDDLRYLLTIDHASFAEPYRFVSADPNEFASLVSNGETYQAFPFSISVLTDSDKEPKAVVRIQNVDDRIGTTLLDLPDEALDVSLQVVLRDTPDVVEYDAVNMELVNVSITAISVEGDLVVRGQTLEPCPGRVLSSLISPVFTR